jgi:hypothetical protein
MPAIEDAPGPECLETTRTRELACVTDWTTSKRTSSRSSQGTKAERARKVADADHVATASLMKADGHTGKDIAKYFGGSRATLYRYLDEDVA